MTRIKSGRGNSDVMVWGLMLENKRAVPAGDARRGVPTTAVQRSRRSATRVA